MEFPAGPPARASASEVLQWLRNYLAMERPDDELCAGALTIGEVIVDVYWREIGDDLVGLAGSSPQFRKMISCCDFDASVPGEFVERLQSLIQPAEQIGRT